MGKGIFRPPTAPKPLNWFSWNSNLRTISWRPPTSQNFISIRRRGWSRRIAGLPLWGFFLCLSFFLVTSSRAQVTPVDWFWRSIRHMTSFYPRMCLLGFRWYCCPFRESYRPKYQFWGVNGFFQAKLMKSKNMHIINTTASIPSKFYTVIKTTKCPSWVIQTHT